MDIRNITAIFNVDYSLIQALTWNFAEYLILYSNTKPKPNNAYLNQS